MAKLILWFPDDSGNKKIVSVLKGFILVVLKFTDLLLGCIKMLDNVLKYVFCFIIMLCNGIVSFFHNSLFIFVSYKFFY